MSNYQCSFGPDAWTISYGDESGCCQVTFDLDSVASDEGVDRSEIVLNPGIILPGVDGRYVIVQMEGDRVKLVLDRVRDHLERLGQKVRIYGASSEPPTPAPPR